MSDELQKHINKEEYQINSSFLNKDRISYLKYHHNMYIRGNMKFFVLENKVLEIDSVMESDIFFIVKDGYLKSLGFSVDDGDETEGIYIEKI